MEFHTLPVGLHILTLNMHQQPVHLAKLFSYSSSRCETSSMWVSIIRLLTICFISVSGSIVRPSNILGGIREERVCASLLPASASSMMIIRRSGDVLALLTKPFCSNRSTMRVTVLDVSVISLAIRNAGRGPFSNRNRRQLNWGALKW